MSLLSICQEVCALTPVAVPSYIVNNPDETAVILLALANRAGNEVSRKPPGGWVSMIREYDFTTAAVLPQAGTVSNTGSSAVITGLTGIELVQPGIWNAAGTGIPNNAAVRLVTPPVTLTTTPDTITLSVPSSVTGAGTFSFGQASYPLPTDFERPIDNTFWDRTRYWSMRGPQSPQQWQLYKSSVIGQASIQRRYRFLSVYSGGGVQAGGGGFGTGGVGNLPGFRKYLSIDPVPFDNGSSLVFEYVSNGWCQSNNAIPQSAWLSDTDVGVDAQMEYLISLNMAWRLLRRLGLSYSEELNDYETQVDKAMAHDGGSAILDLTPSRTLGYVGPFNVQEGFYPGP